MGRRRFCSADHHCDGGDVCDTAASVCRPCSALCNNKEDCCAFCRDEAPSYDFDCSDVPRTPAWSEPVEDHSDRRRQRNHGRKGKRGRRRNGRQHRQRRSMVLVAPASSPSFTMRENKPGLSVLPPHGLMSQAVTPTPGGVVGGGRPLTTASSLVISPCILPVLLTALIILLILAATAWLWRSYHRRQLLRKSGGVPVAGESRVMLLPYTHTTKAVIPHSILVTPSGHHPPGQGNTTQLVTWDHTNTARK